MLEAEQEARRAGGTIGTRGKHSHCSLIPERASLAWVDSMGHTCWEYSKETQAAPDFKALLLAAKTTKIY